MNQNSSSGAQPMNFQWIGEYQLENLRRGQAKFTLVILLDDSSPPPNHSLLRSSTMDLQVAPSEAVDAIDQLIKTHGLPDWWPFVFVSFEGRADLGVVQQLSTHSSLSRLLNVFSCRGGWSSLSST